MPELVYPPKDPVWPPPGAIASSVTKHIVKFTPPRPGRNEQRGPTESFLDICKEHDNIPFEALIEFNFGLSKGEPRYFEKINWYLKHKLKCTKTTEGGNFVFSGGETIYIPAATIIFKDTPPLIAPRRSFGAVRWIQFARQTTGSGEASYMIPGVRRTSEPISRPIDPKDIGHAEARQKGIAALVQFVATTSASRLSDASVSHHLTNLEVPFLRGGEGVGDALQPKGRHEGVLVIIRRRANKLEPNYPKTPFRKPIIVGYGEARNADKMIEDFWRRKPQLDYGDHKTETIIFEYYWGTRLGKGSK